METIQSKRRSRLVRIGSTVGVVIAAALVAWGFSRSNDDRPPKSDTPPTIGVIGGPADVLNTQAVGAPSGTTPVTADAPVVPNGTADIALPPISSDIATP